jgi:hypothetical protein
VAQRARTSSAATVTFERIRIGAQSRQIYDGH